MTHKTKQISTDQESKELRRLLYLIRYYESCIADYPAYATKNPEAERLSVCQSKLCRLVGEARTMISNGTAYDASKAPRSLQAGKLALELNADPMQEVSIL